MLVKIFKAIGLETNSYLKMSSKCNNFLLMTVTGHEKKFCFDFVSTFPPTFFTILLYLSFEVFVKVFI